MRETSIAAHESIRHRKAIDRSRILAAIKRKPQTCDDLEVRLGMSHQTCSARISEMQRVYCGMPACIKRSGKKRKTRSGRAANVMVAI